MMNIDYRLNLYFKYFRHFKNLLLRHQCLSFFKKDYFICKVLTCIGRVVVNV